MRDLNQKQKAAIYDGQQLVAKFNEQFAVGDKAMIRKVAKKNFPQKEVTVFDCSKHDFALDLWDVDEEVKIVNDDGSDLKGKPKFINITHFKEWNY